MLYRVDQHVPVAGISVRAVSRVALLSAEKLVRDLSFKFAQVFRVPAEHLTDADQHSPSLIQGNCGALFPLEALL